MVVRSVLGVPEGAVRAFLPVCEVMCTEPTLVTEELHYYRALLLPTKKCLSGQQKTQIGTERLEVLLHSYS